MKRTTRAIGAMSTAEAKATPVTTKKPVDPKPSPMPGQGNPVGTMTQGNMGSIVKRG